MSKELRDEDGNVTRKANGRHAMRDALAKLGRVLSPGASWTKVKKKGRRAPGAKPGEVVHHQHTLTPRTTMKNRHERRAAAARQRRMP